MSVTITGHGFEGGRVELAFRKAAEMQMRKGMHAVEAATVSRAPFRTGHLRRSITSTVVVTGNYILGVVGTVLRYAPYLEMGTGLYGPRHRLIVPVRARALRFPGGGQSSMFSGGARQQGSAGPGFRLSGQQRQGAAGNAAAWVFAKSVRGIQPRRFFADGQAVARGAMRREILVIPQVARRLLAPGGGL